MQSPKLVQVAQKFRTWLKPTQKGPLTILELYSVYPFPSRLPVDQKFYNSVRFYLTLSIAYHTHQKNKKWEAEKKRRYDGLVRSLHGE